jgi:hypothetical protein
VPDKLPRHEWWRRNYRDNPYLRELSEDVLLERGVTIIAGMLPYMLKGTVKPSRNRFRWLTERWTHFLEEMNHRGIDMRAFGQKCRESAEISAVLDSREIAHLRVEPSS